MAFLWDWFTGVLKGLGLMNKSGTYKRTQKYKRIFRFANTNLLKRLHKNFLQTNLTVFKMQIPEMASLKIETLFRVFPKYSDVTAPMISENTIAWFSLLLWPK